MISYDAGKLRAVGNLESFLQPRYTAKYYTLKALGALSNNISGSVVSENLPRLEKNKKHHYSVKRSQQYSVLY